MKASWKLTIAAVMLAAAAALLVAPMSAFADAEGEPSASDVSAADVGGDVACGVSETTVGANGTEVPAPAEAADPLSQIEPLVVDDGGAAAGFDGGVGDAGADVGAWDIDGEASDASGESADESGAVGADGDSDGSGADCSDDGLDGSGSDGTGECADDSGTSVDADGESGGADVNEDADGEEAVNGDIGSGETPEADDGAEGGEAVDNDGTSGASAGIAETSDDDSNVAVWYDENDDEMVDEESERENVDGNGETATLESAQPMAVVAASADKGAEATANTRNAHKTPAASGNVNPRAAEEDQVVLRKASSVGAASGSEINIALTLVEGAISGSASGPVSWASGKILTEIFGSNITGDVDQKLDEILNALNEIRDAIADLQKTVDAQELDDLLNSMKNLIDANKTELIMTNLKSLDEAGYSPAEYKERMKSALTEGMANGTLTDFGSIASPFNTFDTYVSDLWIAMTTTYDVTINKKSQRLTLMQVYYELLRLKYKWEHQAYEEWEVYNNRCVGLLAASLGLERVSLKARLDMLREYNDTHSDKHDEGAIIALLNETQDAINQVAGYEGTVYDESRNPDKPVAKTVSYPGLFNKQAWDEQYWMYKARPDYRYYWVPGHECLFYAHVNTQDVPYEDTSGNLRDPAVLDGIDVEPSGGGYHVEINYNHWKPFLNYQGTDSPLASETQLKTMYKDYGSGPHLYDIFIKEENGNFLGFDESGFNKCWFVVGQTDAHHITCKESSDFNYRLYTYVVTSAHATQDTIDLARYNEYGTWWNPNRNYIGVGVVRYGPETYRPKRSSAHTIVGETDHAEAEVHTTILYSSDIWWPSYGDLSLGYGKNAHGGVEAMFMDGQKLDASCYTIQDGRVSLKQAYLADLSYGEHELFLDTESGGHAIAFSTQADGVYRVVSGDGNTWIAGSGDGTTFTFKRNTEDEQTFSRLVDVLVDGLSVPQWGFAASPGSAIVTLTAAFMDTLALGAHTLTAVFVDGNDPQATFEVRAASAGPQAVSVACAYDGEPAQREGTPRTGDDSAVAIALLAAMALGSVFVAARVRDGIRA